MHGKIGTYTNKKCRCELCRAAWREYAALKRAMNPEQHAQYWRKKVDESLSFALAYLGGACVACGRTDHLEFDHIDPSTKLDNITNLLKHSRERLLDELVECQLLCRECHLEKTMREAEQSAVHGTRKRYGRGCRCDACVEAYRAKQRFYYHARKERLSSS